jgi:hypothetical protein
VIDAAARADGAGARSLAALVAEAYGKLSLPGRARMLRRLLAPVGSLALAVVGGGAFAKFIAQRQRGGLAVSAADAARTTAEAVYELARYVQQRDPRLLQRLVQDLARTLAGRTGPQVALR